MDERVGGRPTPKGVRTSDRALAALVCPGCGGHLRSISVEIGCARCRAQVTVDEVGVLRFATSRRDWTDLPHPVASALLAATTTEAALEALRAVTPAQQNGLLKTWSGAAALLAPLRPGMLALVLGSSWLGLPRALRSLGVDVVVADWYPARMRLGVLTSDPGAFTAAHVDPRKLPMASGAFDVVFADLTELEGPRWEGTDDVTGAVLGEVRRVLGPQGLVVAATANPLRNWRVGRRSFPSRASALESVLRPWQVRRLREGGFGGCRIVVPVPDLSRWRRLIPEERLREELMASSGLDATASPLRAVARRALSAVGLARWVVPNYLLVAQRDGGVSGRPRMLIEELDAFVGEPPPVVSALGNARAAIRGEANFVKFPLSSQQQRSLVEEADRTLRAGASPFGVFTLPWTRVGDWHGVPHSIYPRVVYDSTASLEALQEVMLAALCAQPTDDLGAVRETAVFRRATTSRGRDFARAVQAERLFDVLLERVADQRTPLGATHGDLHALNILLPLRGHPVIVDFNRFEARNPLLLDATHSAVWVWRRETGGSLVDGLLAFADGAVTGPIAGRAVDLLGDLTPVEAAGLLLIDRIVGYGPSRDQKPWTLLPKQIATVAILERLEREGTSVSARPDDRPPRGL